jgi:AbrB family looped-hinge helix DNA binding protein
MLAGVSGRIVIVIEPILERDCPAKQGLEVKLRKLVQLHPELSQVKVKRKGQVTIPVELRRKFKLEEGSLLEATEHKEGVLFKILPPVKAGKVVGQRKYKEIIHELEEFRRKRWR